VLVAGEADLGKTRLESALGGRARDVGSGFSSALDRSRWHGAAVPAVEALRPLGQPWRAEGRTTGSQLRVFEETLAVLLYLRS